MLSAAVAVSASAGITRTSVDKKIHKMDRTGNKVERLTRASGLMPKAAPVNYNASNVLRGNRDALTWDFEDATQFAQFTIVDQDGDGFNWTYYNNDVADQNGDKHMTAHGGVGLIASASYDNDNQKALTPDNWLISPEVTLGGSLKFWAAGQDASYSAEKFAVYVCVGSYTNVSDFVQVAGDFTATGEYVEYDIDLSAYQGQTGRFAIVHHNVTDMFFLNIDDISLDIDAVSMPTPMVPVVNVTPAATTAAVAWGADDAAAAWNLRYRPYVDTSGNPINCTLPYPGYEEQMGDWGVYDADQDGDTWGLYYSSSAQDDLCFRSNSYDSGTSYDPDNWLLSRDIKYTEGTIVRFDMWGTSQYPDSLMVYAYVYGETEDDDAMYALYEKNLATTTDHKTYELDLSPLAGNTGFIIFRHYNSYDCYYVALDNIYIGDPNAEIVQEAEWIYVNDVTNNNYNITGLTPSTEYEVQVMGYNEAHESAWSDIVNFTTLAEDENNVYILGEVNDYDWAPNDGLKMTYDEENDVYTATVTLDGRGESGENYFSFTTKLAADENDWDGIASYRFGAVSVGDFWYSDDMDGQPLSLTYEDGQAFRVMAGEYKLTLSLTDMKLTINNLNPAPHVLLGDVNNDGEVGIADVSVLIDHLLSGDFAAADEFNPLNADVDQGGDIGIGDVSALIDLLLNS